jgi:zinc/manganese transport system permease protein
LSLAALAFSRPLLFVSLQPELAAAKGVRSRLSIAFLAIVAVATAECAQIVGVLLVFALMVGPAAAAQRLTTGILSGLAVSAGLALAEAWLGITLAFYTDWPSSFWLSALSAAAYFLASPHGAITPRRRRNAMAASAGAANGIAVRPRQDQPVP